MFKFFSRQKSVKTYGQKTVERSALADFFAARPIGPQEGWFMVEMRCSKEVALKIASRVAAKITDLIVEDENGQALTIAEAVAA